MKEQLSQALRKLVFRVYQRLLHRWGGRGLGRYKFVKNVDSWIYFRLKKSTANVFGRKLKLGPRDYLDLSLNEVYEPMATDLVRKIVMPGDCVIDIGANIGYYTIILSDLVGEVGHVYACEPSQLNLKILRENIETNGLTNITVLDFALGENEGPADLYIFPANRGMNRLWKSGIHEHKDKETVKVVRGDYAAELHGAKFDFIKIDVEGYEYKVLSSFHKKQFSDDGYILLLEFTPDFLSSAGSDVSQFLRFLFEDSPICLLIDENLSRVVKVSANELQEFLENKKGGQVNCLLTYGQKKSRLGKCL